MVGDQGVHRVFKIARVGEIEPLVDTQGEHARRGDDGVPVHVAEMLGAGDPPHHGGVRPAGAVEKQRQRQHHAGGDAGLHAHGQGERDGGGHGGEVCAGIVPGALQGAEVHKAEDSHDDRRRQNGDGQVRQKRGQDKGRQRDSAGGEGPGGGGGRAGVEIDHRTREAAGDGIAAGERRGEIGRAEADELLIGIDTFALLRRQGLGDGDRFHEADDGDQHGRTGQQHEQIEIEIGRGKRRQALGHRADQGDAPRPEIEPTDGADRDRDREDRPRLGEDICGAFGQAEAQKERFQARPHPEKEGQSARAEDERGPVRVEQVRAEAERQVVEVMAVRLHAENVAQLARRDDQPGGGDESRDDRVGEKVRQEAQPEHPHDQEKHPRQEGQAHGGHGVAHGPGLGDLAYRRGGHQRDHRHRPHGERAAGPEQGVGDERQDRGV